jgi:hypothetical protein
MKKAQRTTGLSRSTIFPKSGALIALGLFSACDVVCTDGGESDCEEAFIVEFDEKLADGSYMTEITADDAEVSCTFDLPEGTSRCTGDTGKNGLNPVIDASQILIPGTPESVTVRITGATSGESSDKNFVPEYVGQYPNGTECLPVCLMGIDSLESVAP